MYGKFYFLWKFNLLVHSTNQTWFHSLHCFTILKESKELLISFTLFYFYLLNLIRLLIKTNYFILNILLECKTIFVSWNLQNTNSDTLKTVSEKLKNIFRRIKKHEWVQTNWEETNCNHYCMVWWRSFKSFRTCLWTQEFLIRFKSLDGQLFLSPSENIF